MSPSETKVFSSLENISLEDLQITRTSPMLGRPAKEPELEEGRPLVENDLKAFLIGTVGRPKRPKSDSIRTISERHHLLARLLAQGNTPMQCVEVTGYTITTIRALKQSSLFKEQIARYQEDFTNAMSPTLQKLENLMDLATIVTRNTLESGDATPEFALAVLKTMASRVGFPEMTRQESRGKLEVSPTSITPEEMARISAAREVRAEGGGYEIRTIDPKKLNIGRNIHTAQIPSDASQSSGGSDKMGRVPVARPACEEIELNTSSEGRLGVRDTGHEMFRAKIPDGSAVDRAVDTLGGLRKEKVE